MNNRNKIIFVIGLCFIISSAQSQPALDTIQNCLKQKPHLFAKLDTRNSFISNGRAKIFGIKAGLNFGKRIFFGVGYNQLFPPATNFDKQLYYASTGNLLDSVTTKLNLFYISLHFEYVFFQTKYWALSIPLQVGVGKTYYKYILYNTKYRIEENLNFIYEPAISVEYKFVKWFGIGADIGFRFMVTADRKLNQKFNSPTYAFKLLVYYSEIYKSLF